MVEILLTKTRLTRLLILLPWIKFGFKFYINLRQYLRLKYAIKCPKALARPEKGKALLTQSDYDSARKYAFENFYFEALPEICTALNLSIQIYHKIPQKLWKAASFFKGGQNTTSLLNLVFLTSISLSGTALFLLISKTPEDKQRYKKKLLSKTYLMLHLYCQFLNKKYANNVILGISGLAYAIWIIVGNNVMSSIKTVNIEPWVRQHPEVVEELEELAHSLKLSCDDIVLDISKPWHVNIEETDILNRSKLIIPFKVYDKCDDQEIIASLLHQMAHRRCYHKSILLITDLFAMGLGFYISTCLFQNALMNETIEIEESIIHIYIEYMAFHDTYYYFKNVLINYLNHRMEYQADHLLKTFNKHDKLIGALEKEVEIDDFPLNYSLYTASLRVVPLPMTRILAILQNK